MNILVTGSTGQLGLALLDQFIHSDCNVRITSRGKPDNANHFNWVHSDILTGEGLEEAAKDIDVIIHAATSPMKNSKSIDVTGLEKFLSQLQHIKHFIYPSIVGIENIPFKYYRHKYEAEGVLKNSLIPYTIVRATQFHSFVQKMFLSKPLLKRYFIPGDFKFQSVDTGEFAQHLIGLINVGPQGRIDDFGGPEIMTLGEMAELQIKVNKEKNKVISLPLPGKLSKAYVAGRNTNGTRKTGKVTFEQFLQNRRFY
ncbi:SDR family oxidoreductase [Peribacillus glennii]|uniref:NAD-dependent epimerase/dehydratase family protein n=1 Tax=Peribacillus glennii TaxID=2303991 RepID=A0A372LC43_9BACI|nr:NAD(P)H-binding protein [Peribacillus glennii]RFU63112.1 NAD-dependent epimerase/dehydratase family protein [Peribacillus glennii]